MNHELTQREFEQNVTNAVQYALADMAPTDAMPRSVDAARFVEALRAEGYVIEPLPIPATPVPATLVVEHQDDGAEVVNMAGEIVGRL